MTYRESEPFYFVEKRRRDVRVGQRFRYDSDGHVGGWHTAGRLLFGEEPRDIGNNGIIKPANPDARVQVKVDDRREGERRSGVETRRGPRWTRRAASHSSWPSHDRRTGPGRRSGGPSGRRCPRKSNERRSS